MDFNYTQEDQAFRTEVRTWLEANKKFAPPPSNIMADEGEGDWEARVNWHKKLNAGGWVAVNWPKEYGGRGATVMQRLIYREELSRLGLNEPMLGMGINLLGPTLIHWGTEEQKKNHIPKILKGEEVWCQGYSEPGAGSDLASVQTRAVDDGDDFVVNGQKTWTSIAHHADMIFALVRTDPAAPKHKGISYLLIDMHSPGVTVRPLVQMTGGKGFNEVFFEDVRVPKKNIVGERNNGWQVAMTTLMFERGGGGGEGAMGQVYELARLARRIPRSGDGSTAWDDSSVRQKVAEFAAEAQALRYTGYRQLTRQLKGLPPGPEGSMMKLCGTELALKIAIYAMELLGPYSQLEFNAPFAVDKGKWSFRMLAARGPTIYAGTNQIQHNIIGERVLGLPKG
ncbi:acyl-CoA dehydrogenase [Candidatus Binatus sp.]|jgi:alkylation response protein AidB-like acyl-CoA dehydrogenase|uniref:acyl-CoA dehydrogenase n=2 Tax=Candidatus Binatus sp. TaxID=2811406 RepID=UPI003BDF0EF8